MRSSYRPLLGLALAGGLLALAGCDDDDDADHSADATVSADASLEPDQDLRPEPDAAPPEEDAAPPEEDAEPPEEDAGPPIECEPTPEDNEGIADPLALPPLPEGPTPEGEVALGIIRSTDELIEGPKAEGLVGDFIMKNARAAFVIEGARIAGGYRHWGGNLVDAALYYEDSEGVVQMTRDRFGELWFALDFNIMEARSARIISDGSDGAAVLRIKGVASKDPWLTAFRPGATLHKERDVEITYEYTLRPDETQLQLSITLRNLDGRALRVGSPYAMMNMGDGVNTFLPNAGFDLSRVEGPSPWVAAVGGSTSYALERLDEGGFSMDLSYGNMDFFRLPEFPRIEACESEQLDFVFHVSDNATSGIESQHAPQTMAVSGQVEGLLDAYRPAESDAWRQPTWVAAVDPEDERRVLGLALIDGQGRFQLNLPEGPANITAWVGGEGGSAPVRVEAATDDLTLTMPEMSTFVLNVFSAESEEPLPGQVAIFRQDGTPSPFAPKGVQIGEAFGSKLSALTFVTSGPTQVRLPAGEYRLVASRGYTYEIDEREAVAEPGEYNEYVFHLVKSVPTEGWLAADMHLHSRWSSDSDISYAQRMHQAAANDVQLPILTDHAYISTPQEALRQTQLGDWVVPISGQEVTTFEYGHFNLFPLVPEAHTPSNGGLYEFGFEGAELFTAMREYSTGEGDERPVIQINHPREEIPFMGFDYFNHVGLDSQAGEARKPERFTEDWDLLEAFNGSCSGRAHNDQARQDFINLTNLGWKKTLSSGSDSHSIGGGIAHPRNYIELDFETVANDPAALVGALKARRTFVSCGPFVRFTTEEGVGMGERAKTNCNGEAVFDVEVWAPTWMDIQAVRLLRNGVVVEEISLALDEDEEDQRLFQSSGALRFAGQMSDRPTADAWYALEVIGAGTLEPLLINDAPYALTNPIEIDMERDGEWVPPGNP